MPSAVGGGLFAAVSPSASRVRIAPGAVFQSFVGSLASEGPTGGAASYRIAGISRDSNGNPLGNCTVTLFFTGTDQIAGKVVSDANGNWSILVPDKSTLYYAVSYKVGPPDVAGTTVNTLTGT